MTMHDDLPRNGDEVQEAVKAMFLGCAPERKQELEELWKENELRFNVLPDTGRNGKVILDAGQYRNIRFNHRILRAFWVSSFAAWEGYRRCAEDDPDQQSFRNMLECVSNILSADDPLSVPLPDGIPEPGTLDGILETQRAAAELSIFAVCWALLHEVKHIKHQRGGTSAPFDDVEESHAEELSCDEYATLFLLNQADKYSEPHSVETRRVMQKRQAGIHFALFSLTLLSVKKWEKSKSHPSVEARIMQIWRIMAKSPLNIGASAMAAGAFYSLYEIHPDAPKFPEDLLVLQFSEQGDQSLPGSSA
ncbi:MAG: hypothetical protein IPO08_19365 [Xanthomonadales bacterium]|nr:hypothetical protein [Xanthomonadales bacterium]